MLLGPSFPSVYNNMAYSSRGYASKYSPLAISHVVLSHVLAISHVVALQDSLRDLSRVDCPGLPLHCNVTHVTWHVCARYVLWKSLFVCCQKCAEQIEGGGFWPPVIQTPQPHMLCNTVWLSVGSGVMLSIRRARNQPGNFLFSLRCCIFRVSWYYYSRISDLLRFYPAALPSNLDPRRLGLWARDRHLPYVKTTASHLPHPPELGPQRRSYQI